MLLTTTKTLTTTFTLTTRGNRAFGGARRATVRPPRAESNDGEFSFDPSKLPTFGGGGGGGGAPTTGRPGGGLIVPGMDGFDESMVMTNPLSGGGGAPTKPGAKAAIPKVGGELQGAFEPYKPPEAYETAKADEDDPERMLMMMRQRVGLWHALAKFVRPLNSKGYQPNDIFEATGIEPKEQALWVTWLQCYASLKESDKFDSSKLEYFDNEFVGAPNLSQIQYLPAAVRSEAAEFVVDNEFEVTQTRELVKAYEIKKANKSTVSARDFNDTPGDVLAYKLYRDILELQRYQGEEEARKIRDRGIQYAVTETAKSRLSSAVEMFMSQVNAGTSMVKASERANEESEVKAELQTVRLEAEELGFRPVPVVGNYNRLTSAKVRTAGVIVKDGNLFGVFTPPGNTDWVALPTWDLLLDAGEPFAMFCDDTSKLPVEGIKDKSEPGLLVADRKANSPSFGKYYLVSTKSSLVMAGSGSNAETVSIMDGRDILAAERAGKPVTTLARVLLCVRAPSRGVGDGMTTGFVS